MLRFICIIIIFFFVNYLVLTFVPYNEPCLPPHNVIELNDDLVYVNHRNSETQIRTKNTNGGFIRYHINSEGFRGAELSHSKTMAQTFLVGSSIVFGQDVSEENTIASNLTKLYKKEKLSAEIINAGVIAYSLDQKFKYIKNKIIFYKPKNIIFFLSIQDFVELEPESSIINLFDLDKANSSLIERDATKSIFYRSYRFLALFEHKVHMQIVTQVFVAINRISNYFEVKKTKPIQLRKLEKMSEELFQISAEKKINIYFVVLPDKNHSGYHLYDKIKSKIPVYNLNNSKLLISNWRKIFLSDGIHLTNLGTALVAMELFKIR